MRGLYLVSAREMLKDEEFFKKIEDSFKAGVKIFQLREKTASSKEFLEIGRKLKELCKKYNVTFIINDRADIASLLDADGLHLGDNDIDIKDAKKIFKGKIGISAKTVERAKYAEENGADYLGVGAIYKTETKVITSITKVETLRDIINAVSIPVFAIGGLKCDNLDVLKGIDISGICVVSEIMQAENAFEKTRKLYEKIGELNV